jgi:hypothetical protein
MKLSTYIQELQDLQEEHGDIQLMYTAADAEGNGYTRVTFGPEMRLLSPHENQHTPEDLIEFRDEESEDLEEWLDNNCLDMEDLAKLEKVLLL